MEKRGLKLLILFLTFSFMMSFVSATVWKDSHGVTSSIAQPSDIPKAGAKIVANVNSTIAGVTISNSSSATTVYLVADDLANTCRGTVLASAKINGTGGSSFFANFTSNGNNYNLTKGTSYWVAIDGNGSSYSQGNRYDNATFNFANQNVSGANINWTYGCNNFGDAYAFSIFGIVSVWTNNVTDAPPTIVLNSPNNNTNITGNSVTFDYSITDNHNVTNMSIWIDGANNFSQSIGLSSFAANTTISGFLEGTHTWFIQAVDNLNQITNTSKRVFTISFNVTQFENINVTNEAHIGNNLFSLNGFFTFLGSSVSRITKGWFTNIDTTNITTQNIQVNGQNVCLANGTNCQTPPADIDLFLFSTNFNRSITNNSYASLSGINNVFATNENNTKNVIPISCTFKKMYVDVSTNTRTTASNVSLRINSADTGVSVAIPGNTSGVFNSTINFQNINAGSLANYKVISGSGSGATIIRSVAITCEF